MSVLDLAAAHSKECVLAAPKAGKKKFLGNIGIGNYRRPVISESAAVHPRQVKEMAARCREAGVPTEYDSHGRPKLTSKEHKRRFAKVFNYTRRDEFY